MSHSATVSNAVIPILRIKERGTLDWLAGAFGFALSEVTPDGNGGLAHAQLWWGEDCIMVSTSIDENEHAGVTSLYLTVATDDQVDVAYERAVAAGATPIRVPVDQPYGGRGATVGDPDGNQWSLGSYLPRSPA